MLCLALTAVMMNSIDANRIDSDVEALSDAAEAEYADQEDLGESLNTSETEFVGEMSDYKGTKKKLEAEIKKTEDELKKKKADAKKKFDAQMKKSSATFAKLYAPKKKGPSPMLESPLGTDGQSGVSSMAQWAYATQVESWSRIAHKKIEKLEKELEENRYHHFSTAVCKEVLQSKVRAIGDLKFKAEKKKIEKQLKQQKKALKTKIAYDRADMGHKIASFKLWERDSNWAADGGLTGPDPDLTHMMTQGQSNRMGASRVGELTQAAHWAFARQKAHAIDFWERNRRTLKTQLKKLTEQHDLTLCRTGRKPENPQLKYELDKAKGSLKKELKNMPPEAQKAAAEKEKEKKVEKAEKKVKEEKEKGKEEAKEEKKPSELMSQDDDDLGESMDDDGDSASTADGEAIEFHKLIDASGGIESISERVRMFKDLVENEHAQQADLVKKNAAYDSI